MCWIWCGLAILSCAALTQADTAVTGESLAADDECAAGDSECSLQALQLRAHKVQSQADAAVASNATEPQWDEGKNTCDDCMQNNAFGSEFAIDGYIQHYAWNCWDYCHRAGPCPEFCGDGNLCCRYMWRSDPPECKGVTFFSILHAHTCVQGPYRSPATTAPSETTPGTVENPSKTYNPMFPVLTSKSTAPVKTFYMYRAAGDNDFPLANVNAANLAGTLWYLHNEVVIWAPRKFGVTRIMRIKVSTRAPQPLADKGMNFGVRYAFDSGKCTGPWDCQKAFQQYGYFVGCNYVGDFPNTAWRSQNHYKNAIWYSLPGPCSDRQFSEHDPACVQNNPGGACSGLPTGTGDCTFTYENAGQITVDELVGIQDYGLFRAFGGQEYNQITDRGYGTSFWDGKQDDAACDRRVQAALNLFKWKYGTEALQEPPCDFAFNNFYADDQGNLAAVDKPAA